MNDEHRRVDLRIEFRVASRGIEEVVGLYSYGENFFEGALNLRESSEEGAEDKDYTASDEDIKRVMKELVGRINAWEQDEKLMIRQFGDLNTYKPVNNSAPEIYKTGEADSEAFKKLFE